MSVEEIRERLAACEIPMDAVADYAGTNHFEISTPTAEDGWWWLDHIEDVLAERPDPSATIEGKRLGAVLDYATHYKRDVTALLAEIDRLAKEAACPCCKNGVNLEGAVCGECHGEGLAVLAYEHVRFLWKQQRDRIEELEAEVERLKL